jgi:hypothetical protein
MPLQRGLFACIGFKYNFGAWVKKWRALGEALSLATNLWKSQINSFACRLCDTTGMYQQQPHAQHTTANTASFSPVF